MNNIEKLDEFYDWMKRIIETNDLYKQQDRPTYIVCGHYDEYRTLGYMNPQVRMNYRFVYGVDDLRGTSNPKVQFVGNWVRRKDIEDIVMQVKIATR